MSLDDMTLSVTDHDNADLDAVDTDKQLSCSGAVKAVFDQICARLEDGLSLRKAAAELGTTAQTVLGWIKRDKDWHEQYTRAREVAYQCLGDELIDIADDDQADTRRSALMLDTRKWLLAKMLPKVYGDKLVGGSAAQQPVLIVNLPQQPSPALDVASTALEQSRPAPDQPDQVGPDRAPRLITSPAHDLDQLG